eukprot:TRINITY_DN2986_c0_g1_i2.p2 TRINITY_DN2986_c0_g1~~TRINITY_DN2986_c0_g1_i2.p2  ORF type:complete len:186 (+),score=36.89 TRINITY_DN2986_c0_g1_i2:240-797(+)
MDSSFRAFVDICTPPRGNTFGEDPDAFYAFECPLCDEDEMMEEQLVEHIREAHPFDEDPVVCPICSDVTTNICAHMHTEHRHTALDRLRRRIMRRDRQDSKRQSLDEIMEHIRIQRTQSPTHPRGKKEIRGIADFMDVEETPPPQPNQPSLEEGLSSEARHDLYQKRTMRAQFVRELYSSTSPRQ